MDHHLAFVIDKTIFPPAKYGDFGQLATDIVLILTGIAGILAIFFIIFSGLQMVTSSGDEKKLAQAKGTLTYAIIGLVVIALVFLILRVVQFFFKSDIRIT